VPANIFMGSGSCVDRGCSCESTGTSDSWTHHPSCFRLPTTNSLTMNTYRKCACNPRRMNTYKIIGLKVPVESTLTKKGGRGWGYMTLTNPAAPAYNAASPMMLGRPEVTGAGCTCSPPQTIDSPPSCWRAAEFLDHGCGSALSLGGQPAANIGARPE